MISVLAYVVGLTTCIVLGWDLNSLQGAAVGLIVGRLAWALYEAEGGR